MRNLGDHIVQWWIRRLAGLHSSWSYTCGRLMAEAGTPFTWIGFGKAILRCAPTLPASWREGGALVHGGRFFYIRSWPSSDEGLVPDVQNWIRQAAIRARLWEGYAVQIGVTVMEGNRPLDAVWRGTLTKETQATVEADLRSALAVLPLPTGDVCVLLRAACAHQGHPLPEWPDGDRA